MRSPSKRQLAAGVIDASIASIATFVAGLTAVRLLDEVDLGIYGVFFTAFLLGSVIVTELILVPTQVVAVDLPEDQRLRVTRRSLGLGLIPGGLGMIAALAAAGLTGDLTSGPVILALTLTCSVTIVVSPMQDHVRQLLHIADSSWRAVVVSSVQFVGVIIGISALVAADVERAWVPFGSLAMANILSLATGLWLAGAHRRESSDPAGLTFRGLAVSGKWLSIRAAVPAAFGFTAANILTALAGPEAYGHAEAARQVAQPITVLAVGLMAILGPRAVRAGSSGDSVTGTRNRRSFVGLTLVAGLLYIGIAGFDWSLNPMAWLVPPAYVVGGLVIATIVANLLMTVFMIIGRELLGAGHARSLAVISIIATPALPLAAATAGTTGAFARPIGHSVEGIIRVVSASWWLKRLYANTAAEAARSEEA